MAIIKLYFLSIYTFWVDLKNDFNAVVNCFAPPPHSPILILLQETRSREVK